MIEIYIENLDSNKNKIQFFYKRDTIGLNIKPI